MELLIITAVDVDGAAVEIAPDNAPPDAAPVPAELEMIVCVDVTNIDVASADVELILPFEAEPPAPPATPVTWL